MVNSDISQICQTFMSFFDKTVGQVDQSVQFVKRKSKLGAQLFTEVLITGCLSDPAISLERLCTLIKEKGVIITKQGLHQRFNQEATLMMEHLFLESMNHFKTGKKDVLYLLKPFSSLKLLDSSGILLSESIKDLYRGCGGDGSEVGLKIQVLFDYIQGQVSEVTLTEGYQSDRGFNGCLEWIDKGGLYLQDLGYFKLKFFERIQAQEAYFISRHSYPTKILSEDGEPLDLLKELRETGSFFAKEVRLGKKEKLKVRLIAFRLSEEGFKKRLKKIKKREQKRGAIKTQAVRELAHWSIYVTNISEDWLTDEQIQLVYSLRWQI